MKIKYYIVDAFTEKRYGGNPAAVCLLEEELSDEQQQKIAAEINLSETAFVIKKGNEYGLRWFTLKVEVELCGHATLASGYVLLHLEKSQENTVEFNTLSGRLTVTEDAGQYWLRLPKRPVEQIPHFTTFDQAFGMENFKSYKAYDFLLVFDSAAEVAALKPDFQVLKNIKEEAQLQDDVFGVIATAKGDEFGCDFVSRFFAPNAGINEDPVTGRAHSSLVPYWSQLLGKKQLKAKQLSERLGVISCINNEDETIGLGGGACLFSQGWIMIDSD